MSDATSNLTTERVVEFKFAYMSAKVRGAHRLEVGREDFGDLIALAEENARLRESVDRMHKTIALLDDTVGSDGQRIADLEAALAPARADMQERCAKVADDEALMRRKREDTHRRDGGEYEARIQGHKSITASAIAVVIRNLPPTETTTG